MNKKASQSLISFLILICSILFTFGITHAAEFYVKKGASGDGSNWNNAWDDLGNINGISTGDVIYIASGTYTDTFTFSSNGITLIRATIENHGTNTGWNNSYDNKVVVYTSASSYSFMATDKSNITIDGVNRSNFIIKGDSSRRPSRGIYLFGGKNNTVKNLTVYGMGNIGIHLESGTGKALVDNVEVYHCGHGSNEGENALICLERLTASNGWDNANIVRNSYLHDPTYDGSNVANDILVGASEYVMAYNNKFDPGWVSSSSSDSISIRKPHWRIYNNDFEKSYESNVNQTLFISDNQTKISDIEIYNNKFYQPVTTSTASVCVTLTAQNSPNRINGVKIHNNYFFGHWWAIRVSNKIGGNCDYLQNVELRENTFHAKDVEIKLDGNNCTNSFSNVDLNHYVQDPGGVVLEQASGNRTLSYVRSAYGWDANGTESLDSSTGNVSVVASPSNLRIAN